MWDRQFVMYPADSHMKMGDFLQIEAVKQIPVHQQSRGQTYSTTVSDIIQSKTIVNVRQPTGWKAQYKDLVRAHKPAQLSNVGTESSGRGPSVGTTDTTDTGHTGN